MSKLTVGSIEGLASEGYVISVPAGSKIVQAGAVLQVVQTVKTNHFTTTSTTMVDVTGISQAITPSSTSNKVLVRIVFITGNNNASMFNAFNLVRGSTNIGIATGGTSVNYTSHLYTNNASGGWGHVIEFLDSPSTTSSITYKLQMAVPNGGTGVVGRYALNDSAGGISTITLLEIAG